MQLNDHSVKLDLSHQLPLFLPKHFTPRGLIWSDKVEL